MTTKTTATPTKTYCARTTYPWSPKFGPTPYALHNCTGGTFCKGNCKPAVSNQKA